MSGLAARGGHMRSACCAPGSGALPAPSLLSRPHASARQALKQEVMSAQSPRALHLVASGQAVAGPPTPDTVRPRLALPSDGYGAELQRALSTPHQVC